MYLSLLLRNQLRLSVFLNKQLKLVETVFPLLIFHTLILTFQPLPRIAFIFRNSPFKTSPYSQYLTIKSMNLFSNRIVLSFKTFLERYQQLFCRIRDTCKHIKSDCIGNCILVQSLSVKEDAYVNKLARLSTITLRQSKGTTL